MFMRSVDDLGRITLPKEMRESLGIGDHTRLNIMQYGRQIILEQPGCMVCGYEKVALKWNNLCLCEECLAQLFTTSRETVS